MSKLAAIFHDFMFYSIDGRLPNDCVEELIGKALIDDDGKVTIVEDKLDTNANVVMDMLGFKPEQTLDPFKVLN